MKKIFRDIERGVDHSIPAALLLLLVVIIAEIFFYREAEPYHFYIEVIDWFVVILFVIDLTFKYRGLPNPVAFVKKYWLDILAVFPFYLVFRVFETILLLGRAERYLLLTQDVVHGGVETTRLASRGEKFTRFLKPILRAPRFLKAAGFFKKP